MLLRSRPVFSLFGNGRPQPVNSGGGYKYQPGTILAALAPVSPTTPSFGNSFSPPPKLGTLWGSLPPTASGNPYTPAATTPVQIAQLPSNTGGGSGGFFTSLNAGLFK